MVAVPILLHTLAKKNVHGRHLITIGNNKHIVAYLHLGRGKRDNYIVASPNAGDNEVAMGFLRYLGNGLTRYSWVDNNKLSNKGLVVIIRLVGRKVVWAHNKLTQQYHGNNNTYNTKRIGNSTTKGCTAT